MELHHIDGKRTNHHLSNLMLLCPNCHSQTDTFRARNRTF
jgi:5-methylcytosine-specific restriction endonuclease McrA